MIYGLLDWLSNRRKADKTYELEELVEQKLREVYKDLPPAIIDSEMGRPILHPSQSVAIYTIIGFDPKTDPSIAEQMPELEENSSKEKGIKINLSLIKDPIVRMVIKLRLELFLEDYLRSKGKITKFDKPLLSFPASEDSVCGILQKYNIIEDQELPYLSFNQSGKILYGANRDKFIGVLSEIVCPLYFLDRERQLKYLIELKEIKESNSPSIIDVAASALNLTQQFRKA